MTTLAQYDRARAALAEATTVSEVLSVRDEIEHIKLYARQIRDQELVADAVAFQVRIDRRLGVLLAAATEAGHLARKGRRQVKSTDDAAAMPATLEEIGVDRKLSAKAKRLAALSDEATEQLVQATRERVVSGRANVIDAGPIGGARAVMGSRAEPDDSLDYFPTPPWATRALLECVLPRVPQWADVAHCFAWEPACGEGHIAEVLFEYFADVFATDIFDYGYGTVADFLADGPPPHQADWIITNPPFRDKAAAFVLRALDHAGVGVAMFLPLRWLETVGRYEDIFRDRPPTMIAFFVERVPLQKGRWNPDGDTATAYIWLVWRKGAAPVAPMWIPPGQRETLTRSDDAIRFTAKPVTRAASRDAQKENAA